MSKPIPNKTIPYALTGKVGRPRSPNPKPKRNFCLSHYTMDFLSKIKNASKYVDSMLLNRATRARKSLLILREAGWSNAEILAACEACSFEWRDTASLSVYFATLETVETYGTLLSERILDSDCEALALHEMVTEYHCGNTAIQESLRE